jgi:hypothetical protein
MKSSLKSIVTGIVAASGLLLGAVDASAECRQEGIVKFSEAIASNLTRFYITDKTTVLPTVAYFYLAAANTSFHEILSDAQAAGQIVKVTGNATVCPTTGNSRNAGAVTKVERYDH